MIPSSGSEKRRLVPRWRSLAATMKSKELWEPAKRGSKACQPLPVELIDRIENWRRSHDLFNAAELVELAIVTGNETEGVEAARRLMHIDLEARPAIRMQAATLLVRAGFPEEVPEILLRPSLIDGPRFRAATRLNPRDPLARVELALHQTVLGHVDAAKRSMAVALHLAPNNRHVLRSAARLFLHADDPERAHDLLARNLATPTDPWLLSAEIAIAGLAERQPRFMKAGSRLLEDAGQRPGQITELAGAVATMHLLSGRCKKSRRMFATSMEDPTANALAQGEWASSALGDLVPLDRFQSVFEPHEAEALYLYRQARFESVATACLKWAEADPFSVRPFELGSIAANNVDDYGVAIEMAKLGLKLHSHPFRLRQSLVYALASSGQLYEAETEFKLMRDDGDPTFKALKDANLGLISFRKGEHQLGRFAYKSAMEGFRRVGREDLQATAAVNFARECLLINLSDAHERMSEAERLMAPFKNSAGAFLLERVKNQAARRREPAKALTDAEAAKLERLRPVTWSIQGQAGPPRRLLH